MTRHFLTTGAALSALIVAAGCSPSVPTFNSASAGPSSGPSPLLASPTPQVSQGRLPPPPAPPAPNQPTDTSTDTDSETGETEVASLEPDTTGPSASSSASSGGGNLSRNSVLGAYKVTTAGGNCQIILSLTQWSGGYRAASRGCPGTVADVSAWDVSGNNVVLKNSNGSQVASLASSGGSRFDGQTQGGEAISLYR